MNRFRKWTTWLVVILAVGVNLLTITPTAVYACSCVRPESPDKELERATAVFAGKVTAIDRGDGLFNSGLTPVEVTFQVSEVWKGPAQATLIVHTGWGGGDCGYGFQPGNEYLVYAHGSETELKASICSRTASLATAVTDLTTLGAGKIPPPDSPGGGLVATWLPAAFFILLGAFPVLTGLFMPRLNRRLGIGERSRLFSHHRFQRSARQTEFLGQIVQISLGLGLLAQGIGHSFYPHEILNVFSYFFLGLAGIGLLAIWSITARNWRA